MQKTLSPQAACAALLAALAATPAQAVLINYQFTVPGLSGVGSFSFDDSTLHDDGGGSYDVALASFAYSYAGYNYSLADASSFLAWFYDSGTGPEFVGSQYFASHGGTSVEFNAGFGYGDMGTFSATGAAPFEPTALTNANFTQIPEPGTAALLLAGAMAFGQRRKSN